MRVRCSNSDGIPNFYWSHDGYWFSCKVYPLHNKSTAKTCAQKCNATPECVAIEYTKRDSKCRHYHNITCLTNNNKISTSDRKSYMKCIGSISFNKVRNSYLRVMAQTRFSNLCLKYYREHHLSHSFHRHDLASHRNIIDSINFPTT